MAKLILFLALFQTASANANQFSNSNPIEAAAKELLSEGVNADFVKQLVNQYNPDARDDVVQKLVINGMFSVSTSNYDAFYSDAAVQATVDFIANNQPAFDGAELLYGVDMHVISALMRVETKHGGNTGDYHIANVFFSAFQALQPEVAQSTDDALDAKHEKYLLKIADYNLKAKEWNDKHPDEPQKAMKTGMTLDTARSKLPARNKKWHDWALPEIKALSKMLNEKNIAVFEILGSYAGAFGLCQFLPSSYMERATSPTPGKVPDLFDPADAIYSVAKYLKRSGWNQNDPSTWKPALATYNTPDGYGSVILKIASAAETKIMLSNYGRNLFLPKN